jgi:hypothetical protein
MITFFQFDIKALPILNYIITKKTAMFFKFMTRIMGSYLTKKIKEKQAQENGVSEEK